MCWNLLEKIVMKGISMTSPLLWKQSPSPQIVWFWLVIRLISKKMFKNQLERKIRTISKNRRCGRKSCQSHNWLLLFWINWNKWWKCFEFTGCFGIISKLMTSNNFALISGFQHFGKKFISFFKSCWPIWLWFLCKSNISVHQHQSKSCFSNWQF